MFALTWITEKELERVKKKGDEFCWKKKHENFIAAVRKWEMFAVSKERPAGWKWAVVKKNTSYHEDKQQNFWWARTAIPPLVVQNGIAVVQNNGKQLYKKGGLHVQICFFANRSIDFVAVLVTVAV